MLDAANPHRPLTRPRRNSAGSKERSGRMGVEAVMAGDAMVRRAQSGTARKVAMRSRALRLTLWREAPFYAWTAVAVALATVAGLVLTSVMPLPNVSMVF